MDAESSEEDLRGILKTRKFNFCIAPNSEDQPKRFESVDQAIAEFGYLEIKLNSVRHILSDIDIQSWNFITDLSDISAKFKTTILSYFQRCLITYVEDYKLSHHQMPTQDTLSDYCCEPEMLTRAWIKFHEILSKYEIIDKLANRFSINWRNCNTIDAKNSFRVLFLCEAPGGFVSAFNNHVSGQPFRWVASSLNPYHEACGRHNSAITDDRLIADTYTNWYFGPDNTGHVGNANYVNGLRDFVRQRWPRDCGALADKEIKFHLVTADGGLDCADQPQLQEQLSFNLIVREIHVALNILKTGGTLVVKFFNCFKRGTVYLLHVLYETFEQVSSFKPISSKGGNSEVYVIGVGFRLKETSAAAIERFEHKIAQYRSLNSLEFPIDWHEIPTDFIYLAYENSHFFTKKQIAVIRHNVFLYECSVYEIQMKGKSRLKSSVAKRFLTCYPIQLVGESRSLAAKHYRETGIVSAAFDEKEEADKFFKEMQKCIRLRFLRYFVDQRRGSLKWRRRVARQEFTPKMVSELMNESVPYVDWAQKHFRAFFTLKRPDLKVHEFAERHLKLVYGRSYDYVQNSRVCEPSLLHLRDLLQQENMLVTGLSLFEESHMNVMYKGCNNLTTIRNTLTRHLTESQLINDLKTIDSSWSVCNLSTSTKKYTYKTVAQCLQDTLHETDRIHLPITNELPENVDRPQESYVFVFESDPNTDEVRLFDLLVDKLIISLPLMKPTDLFIIRVDLVITRLLSQLLYLLTLYVFDQYSVVPLVLQSAIAIQSDRSAKSVLANLIAFRTKLTNDDQSKSFNERCQLFLQLLQSIKRQQKSMLEKQLEDTSLLELFPPPLMYQGKYYFNFFFIKKN